MNIAAIVISIFIILFGFAGGGGSSSGGSSGGGSSSSSSSYSSSSHSSGSGESNPIADAISITIFVGILIAVIVASKKAKDPGRDYNSSSAEKQIHTTAEQIFLSYQQDWTDFNYDNIKKYTTDAYFQHASLMLDLLKEMHRVNQVSKVSVKRVKLLNPVPDNTDFSSGPISIRIRFTFNGLDEVYDTKENKRLYHHQATSVTETWNFLYDGKSLKLAGISQPTESASHLVKSLASFATENGMFYSPDWGRYCLPSRGLIFGGASMKVADVNNHIIGRWNAPKSSKAHAAPQNSNDQSALSFSANRGGLLVQMYTYHPTPDAPSDYYVVGQITVPKSYLGVIVKSKEFKSGPNPGKSYETFELEWPDFNHRYTVYAASRDALPAFELLDPTFMEFLYRKNPAYNLEVADDNIYIYVKLRAVSPEDYTGMLSVLSEAHKRLKM